MSKIKDSTILVTGGAGNIGSHIVDMCVKNDAKKVIVIDDFSRGVMSNLMCTDQGWTYKGITQGQ